MIFIIWFSLSVIGVLVFMAGFTDFKETQKTASVIIKILAGTILMGASFRYAIVNQLAEPFRWFGVLSLVFICIGLVFWALAQKGVKAQMTKKEAIGYAFLSVGYIVMIILWAISAYPPEIPPPPQ